MNTPEEPACTMRPTHKDSFIYNKDSHESRRQTVSSRIRQRFPIQPSTGHAQHLNHETTNLIAKDDQLNEEPVQIQWNKISFPRAIAELDPPRGFAGTAQETNTSIDFGNYDVPKKNWMWQKNSILFLHHLKICEWRRSFVWRKDKTMLS